jgi:hypothetical protein
VLDIERDIEGEPFAARPGIMFALRDWQKIVALVMWQLEHGLLSSHPNSVGNANVIQVG